MREAFAEPLALIGTLVLLALPVLTPGVAAAQAGAGAERYEVTITPPKRPGSEPAADATAPAAAGEVSPSTAVPAAGAAPADAAAPPDAAAKAPAPAGDNVLGGAQADLPATQAAAPAPSNLPLRTLQVGAFRQHDSAQSLHDQLESSFHDVTIFEVSSGGEPLYRVNVGRLPKGPALADLKRRLSEAGYPAFDVPAPKAAAGD